MSKKIKAVFDIDPAGGNDRTLTVYIPVEDDLGSAIALSTDQLAGMISNRLGLDSNLGTEDRFAMTVPNNSLSAVVSPPQTLNYTRWLIETDTTATPATNDPRWATGTVDTTFTLADYDPHKYYLWVETGVGITQVLPVSTQSDNATVEGLVLQAVDTQGPVVGTLTVVAGSVPSSRIKYTLPTPVDNGVGFSYAELYHQVGSSPDKEADTLLETNMTLDVQTELTGLASNFAFELYARAYDNLGNSSTSNVVTISTDLGVQVSNVVIDAIPVDTTTATVSTFTYTGTPLKYMLTVDDSVAPGLNDTRWVDGAPVTPISITGLSVGAHKVRAYVADSGSVSAPFLVDIVVTQSATSNPIFEFDTDSTLTKEENAEYLQIKVKNVGDVSAASSVDVSYTEFGPVAVDANYKIVDTTLNFAINDTEKFISLPIVPNNLGINGVTVRLTLVNPSSGSIGGLNTHNVVIRGTEGQYQTGDMDLNTFVSGLYTAITPTDFRTLLQSSNNSVIDGYRVDWSTDPSPPVSADTNNAVSVTVQNCIFENALQAFLLFQSSGADITIRNCKFKTNNLDAVSTIFKSAIVFNFRDGTGLKVLNCLFEDCNGGIQLWAGTDTAGFVCEYNTLTDMADRVFTGSNGGSKSNPSFISFAFSTGVTGLSLSHNIKYSPNGDYVEDHINTVKSRCTAASPGIIEDNLLWGSKDERLPVQPFSGSSACIQLGDVPSGSRTETGYYICQDNVCMDQIHGDFIGVSAGHDIQVLRNFGFNPIDRPALQPTWGVLNRPQRQGGCMPGMMYNITSQDNKAVIYYESSPGGPIIERTSGSYANTGANNADDAVNGAGQPPNVSLDGTNEQAIVGATDSTDTNLFAIAEWKNPGSDGKDGHSGYDLLWRNYVAHAKHPNFPAVILQGATGHFTGTVGVDWAWNDPVTGPGTLSYDAGTGGIKWKAFGDSYGAEVTVNTGTIARTYQLYSGNGDSVWAYINPVALPSSGVTTYSTYTVTQLKLGPYHRYAGIAGDYSVVSTPGSPPTTGDRMFLLLRL